MRVRSPLTVTLPGWEACEYDGRWTGYTANGYCQSASHYRSILSILFKLYHLGGNGASEIVDG